MKATAQEVITYTNEKLNDWYKKAKEYGVNGVAIAFLHNNQIVIDYSENGVNGRFSLDHYEDEAMDYVFNVWSEEADLQVDKVF
ncbi:hypothetical protein CEY12_06365 [Chryseobacterium sp. T16E-39]|uniref:hypothetical protein n=1 Tax=Chryseobacterium sp. T16E-39 TaxID=2015076 RepID=UPI000B5B1628|nr:hypothetical protein [Chryseobacterium sp. T16E-39]ASK29752.1 hypothetical protein CEY12_06365 [Chryseobacterium sp. T16E-39]